MVATRRVRSGEDDLLGLYLHDVGQYALLSKTEEVCLAQRIDAGTQARRQLAKPPAHLPPAQRRSLLRIAREGDEAHDAFVRANLRLVVSIAKRYRGSGLSILDLIQDGNLGLIHAVEKFDWRKGFKFSTYASWWIRQAITRSITNTARMIRVPVHASHDLARLQQARVTLEARFGRTATLPELAAELGMPSARVSEILRIVPEPVSLSAPRREAEGAELGDVVADRSAESPFEAAATALLALQTTKLLACLDERERRIIVLRIRPRSRRATHTRGAR